MQPYFADVLNEADIDAIIFDAFSNPRAPLIEERLIPFVESIRRTHPDDYGYRLWERSVEKPILRILRKSGL